MTRSLRGSGLVVVVLLAFCGPIASAATAHTPARFTSEQSETTVRGQKDPGTTAPVLKITGQEVTCETEEFHGTGSETSLESVTITPAYTGCTAFGFVGAKVTGFGHYPEQEGAGPYCTYRITAAGTLDLVCPEGKQVEVEASTCKAHIPAQSNLGTIEYTTGTREGKHDLTLDVNLSGIKTNHTDGFACPLPSGGESATATLVGKWTFWGQDPKSGAAVGITWDATVG